MDPRFQQQPSLRYPPVIPETTGFQGPFIPLQTFPQTPTFPQPQPFTQPITVKIPAFHDQLLPFGPVPAHPPQTFPQTPTFPQPQPFNQHITVKIPAFHD